MFPHEVPVAIDSKEVTKKSTTATVLPVTPNFNEIIIIEAPTPVVINVSATAYANISIKNTTIISLTALNPFSIISSYLCFSVIHAISPA